MKAAYHSILVHLATGPLVMAVVVATFYVWFPVRGDGILAKFRQASDSVVLYSVLFGAMMMGLAFVTGFLLIPAEAVLNSPITKNKITLSAFAMVFWCTWLVLRYRSGRQLWSLRGYVGHYAYLMLVAGTMSLVAVNSIGGDIAGRPSGYEALAATLGFQTRKTLYFPTWMNVLLLATGILALILAFVRRKNTKKTR